MQINYMPANECLGAKSQGNMAKVNSCFPSGDKGFLQFWIGLQNMADEAGANSHGLQDHSDELSGQEDEAEKRACPVAFSFLFGIQALETGEKDFLHVLKTEGFPNCMQIGAEQDSKSRVSLPGMEAQGLTELDTQKRSVIKSKNQAGTSAFAAITCSSGPPWVPGKTALSIGFAHFSLVRMIAPRGPRSVLWVVKVTMSQ